jgi:crotonobetainyl-CoA:carnitine CoA-transferase CaiB-like acyl-CoA transferase
VPCSLLYSIADIFEDPQYKARENLLRVDDPRAGEVVLPASVPRMSETPPQFRHAGPALGADTGDVYGSLLGLDTAALDALRKSGVI